MQTFEIFTLVFSGIVAVSTTIYAILTYNLTKQTKLSREFQLEAHIIAYLTNLETDPTVIRLVIKNIGKGVAKNVTFKIIKDINYENGWYQNLENLGIFEEGIQHFPPNVEYGYILTNFTTAAEKKKNDYIEFNVLYTDLLKEKRINSFRLSFGELMGLTKRTPPENYIGMISYRLEKIEKILSKLIKNTDS